MAKLVVLNGKYLIQGLNIIIKLRKDKVLTIRNFIGGTKILLNDGSFIAFSETSEPVFFAPRR